MGEQLKPGKPGMCLVVTVIPCDHPDLGKEAPEGCISCGMLDWLSAFPTEDECNAAYMRQYPDEFADGKYVGEKTRRFTGA